MYRTDVRTPFRTIVSEYIQSCLSSAVAAQSPEKKGNNVLVVDDYALAIINAAVSQSDLVKAGFITVCPFETKKELADGLRRRAYPALDALYFMRPKKTNIQRLLDDFKQDVPPDDRDIFERYLPCLFRGIRGIEGEPPMYAAVRSLILPGVKQRAGILNWQLADEFIRTQVTARGKELERLLKCYKSESEVHECAIEVMAYEANLFSLDTPDTLSTVYTHKLAPGVLEGDELEDARDRVFDHLDTLAYRLMTALVALNEAPYIRYCASARGIAEVVARSLAKQFKTYRDDHPEFQPGRPIQEDDVLGRPRLSQPTEAATVIVVDRADDLGPVLLHDITYSCLVTDLLSHDPCTPFAYSYQKGGTTIEKDVLLDASDPVWRHLQYEEMGTVIETIDDGVRAANARFDARKQLDPSDMSDLRKMMSALTTDEKLVDEKFAQHYRMKAQVVDLFERRNMHELCTLEQLLVTGCDANGGRPASKEVERSMRVMMQDERLTSEDQVRLLMLYLLCTKAIDPKLRNELIALSRISKRHQAALLNLPDLHVPIQRGPNEPKPESAPFYDDDTLKRNRKIATETRRLCRYVTKLEDVVHNHLGNTLPEEQYPYIKAPSKADRVAASKGAVDPTHMSTHAAMHSAHGEAVNKYTSEVLQSGIDKKEKDVTNRKTKKSRFAGAGGRGDGSDDATPSASGKAKTDSDMYDKFIEPPKPRAYLGGRIIVFVVGGLTQVEIAALERISKETNREIIYGGTSLMTPRDFLDQLQLLDPEEKDLPMQLTSTAGATGGAGIGKAGSVGSKASGKNAKQSNPKSKKSAKDEEADWMSVDIDF